MSAARHRRRRSAPSLLPRAALVVVVLAGVAYGVDRAVSSSADTTTTLAPPTSTTSTTSTTVPLVDRTPSGPPADTRHLVLYRVIGGDISPKSVDSTNTGLVFAQNMMYRHTVTVYTSSGALKRTISDGVYLASFGVRGRPGLTHGAPVEGAVEPDGQEYWVSNYSMYGEGSGPEGSDTCTPESAEAAHNTPSFLYRINTSTLRVDGVAPAGLVPKFVAVTPDGRYVLATNWCSWNLTIDSTSTLKTVATIPIGAYPRGIAIPPDSRYAYVAVMGGTTLAVVDLQTFKVVGQIYVGSNPRSVVVDPADPDDLFVSLNQPGDVVKVNRVTHRILAEVHTGSDCRSLVMSTDGTAVFVVNYLSNTMTMLRASDLKVLQVVSTGTNPVGITYDGTTGRVWVAVYTGEIMVFDTVP